jgi:ABC-type nitrate/sulfonate/bicarbonate transport system permease component
MNTMKINLAKFLPPVLVGLVVISAIQAYTVLADISPLLLPAPFSVFEFVFNNFGLFVHHSITTVNTILVGYAMGILLGIVIGILINGSTLFRDATYPWLVASQMIPVAAIAPILILWFGFTMLPKVIVVTLIAFFPVAVNTADGLRSVDTDMVSLLKSMGASKRKILFCVRIPSALPYLFSGLRIAMALSVLGAVFGEWVGSTKGLGFLMLNYNNKLNTPGLFAAVMVLSIIGIFLFFMVGVVERIAVPWKSNSNL